MYDDIPLHDFESDTTISEKRKEACRLNYLDMDLHHLDKLYTSTFVYDKATGEIVAKKPRSIHELVFNLVKSVQGITLELNKANQRIQSLNDYVKNLSKGTN